MKKNYAVLFTIGLLLLLAVITNPNQGRHQEVIRGKFNSYLQKAMSEGLSETDNEWEQAGQAMGMMLATAIIDQVISNLVTTDNYLIFSITKLSWEDESKVIGIGAFGNVFITGKLDEALNEGLLSE